MDANTGTKPIKVLHVDDDSKIIKITSEFLERENEEITVKKETNVTKALEKIRKDNIDCVISDYEMPEKNGIELLQQVRKRHPNLPFILFTSKGSEKIASEAIQQGVTGYLRKKTKPDQYKLLANRIKKAVKKYRAEKKIEKTKKRFNKLLKNSADYIFTLNPSGEIQYVTPSVVHVLGYTPEELTGTEAIEYVHPEDSDKAKKLFNNILDSPKKQVTEELRIKHIDGSWRWIELRARNLLDDPEIQDIVINASDITKRKKRTKKLEKYKNIVEASGDIVYTLDDEGKFTFVNDAFTEVTWYEKDEILGKHVSFIMDEEEVEPGEKLVKSLIFSDKERETFEMDLITKDGKHIPCENHISLLPYEDEFRGTVGVIRDITQRKEREKSLERYQKIVENSDDGIYIFDENANFEFVNERVVEVSGIPRDEWIGRNVSIHKDLGTMTQDEVDEVKEAINSLIQRKEDEIRLELSPDVPHDIEIIELRLTYFDSGDGEYVIGFSRDITERKKREEELKRERDRFNEFASIISHDLRNPLSVASGHLELVQQEFESRHLDEIEANISRINEMIDNLLKLAREGEKIEEKEPVEISNIVKNSWKNVRTQNANLEIESNAQLQADKSKLQQLFENLIRNAVEHNTQSDPQKKEASTRSINSSENNQIEKGVDNKPTSNENDEFVEEVKDDLTIYCGVLENNGFYIEDDGCGIPEEYRDKIFISGFTSDENGVGFGLSIVEKIVEAHGWNIEFTEGVEGGARFEITDVSLKPS